jgi:two-component system sensor histidine kinase DesK
MHLLPKHKELGWTPYFWTVYIAFFLTWPAMKSSATTLEWSLTILGAAIFFVFYFMGYWSDRLRNVAIVAMAMLAVVYFPFNYGAGSFFIYAAAFAGWLRSTKQTLWVIAGLEVLAIAESIAFRIPIYGWFWPCVFTILIAAANMHQQQRAAANARLRLAHDEIEHLAKVAERERIARDLHDLLGHTLSLIILKSELASKLADRDIERAREEIRDVERISRDALAQVRHAVGGFRSRGLQAEIESARDTLTAANVTLAVDIDPFPLQPAHEAVLTLAIREGITNVVRHARALHCTISLHETNGAIVLTISDDGRGGGTPFGHGLNGMRERVESLGGTLTRDCERGTSLQISIPVPQVQAQERTA